MENRLQRNWILFVEEKEKIKSSVKHNPKCSKSLGKTVLPVCMPDFNNIMPFPTVSLFMYSVPSPWNTLHSLGPLTNLRWSFQLLQIYCFLFEYCHFWISGEWPRVLNFRSVHMMILRPNFHVTQVVGCGGFFQQLYFSVNKPFLPTMERITTTKSKMFQPMVK